ncbi:hypothetical protein M3G03_09950 [Aestuariimicrobium sp. p3-SID1156]|uniref:hypothetical protein n=1 Tax=Aestuariimicrobium sp. p3-SID1156 TaxID=2916038 RepID=UPI00223B0DC2|nr:hypothetical protein [Aestuariimicrobium sp. p3-SID1156]MCT1459852.1 hypothetical protein [Aestuariimicrobium sp. p3-SID1156]
MSSAVTELTPPAGARYGWITGRQLSADLDGTDSDKLTAFEASSGWVTFVPADVTVPGPDSVAVRPLRFQLRAGDLINPRTNTTGPHAILEGRWNVVFGLLNGDRLPMIVGVPISADTHTQTSPLPLGQMRALAGTGTTTPGTGGGTGSGITVSRTVDGVLAISTTTRTAGGALTLGA